jgi:hypothetical protein
MAKKSGPDKASEPTPDSSGTESPASVRRRENAARTRRDQRQQEYEKQQKQWFWTKIGLAAFAAIIIAVIGWNLWGRFEEWQVTRDVDTYFGATDFVATHNNAEPILYEQIPPVGGYHRNAWQNCGFYPTYIENEYGVHALEHGAVWITYDPDLPQEDIDVLKAKAEEQYILVSPYPGMDSPVVASVWGKQLKLDGVHDDRLDPFISYYKKNVNNSPEPYGICWSGVSVTTDQVPQQEPYIRPADSDPVGGIPVSTATALAAEQNGTASTPPVGTVPPVVTPAAASPEATPGASPVASPVATPAS